ncbi:hypothetical protein JY651_45265 [Pyxidicoccus parkwayensis]|uniref:Uncharacterized protein n=1 Tax=Pyxidicoccus parkwayensis TaxID=2813578 RepID=A0ABX7NTP0_9BACT|nr:hypothetical protein [Pyxidicoccus parkwaysis]QSQ22262.1 hypothetical protein JY651_45265 [Pyxidicoccus parkwaysis]
MSTETKVKKVKELFVQDLARIRGGAGQQPQQDKPPKCPEFTTLACGEEPNGCSGC